MNVTILVQLFERCLSPNPEDIREAECHITSASTRPEFIKHLLQIIGNDTVSLSARQLATICFKNHMKRFWDMTDGLSAEDRSLIKDSVINLVMATSGQHQIGSQLSSAIEHIASIDFPNEWQTLLPDIMTKYLLNPSGTLQTKCAAIAVVDAVLERYRRAEHSNDVLSELKFHILPNIEQPLLRVFTESLTAVLNYGNNAASSPEFIQQFNILLHAVRIFYSLISVDLPEFIEDSKAIFFQGFLKILEYQNVNLSGRSVDSNVEGSLEEIKAEVCRVFTHFAQRYCEESEDIINACVESVLKLLQVNTSLDPYMDGVISSGMKFLGAAAKFRWDPTPFTPERLSAICQHVVVPNIRLRDSDLELIEENPQEFIWRALEGAEVGTRRGTAVELVQALSQMYEPQISQILPTYINSLLEASSRATTLKEKHTFKDAAVYLVIAVVVKAESRLFGVSQVNPSVDISSFFTSQLVEELKFPSDGKISNTLVRSAALKFVATFRNQLEKEILLQLLPIIVKNINTEDSVVHTHASYCLECLLLARQLPTENTAPSSTHARGALKFNRAEIKQSLLAALEPLLKAATSRSDIRENEYPMRCVLKSLIFLQEESREIILRCLETLRNILEIQIKNSNNPIFAHFLFESIGTAARIASSLGQQLKVEEVLVPVLTQILTQGNQDFSPYALQMLGLLLDTAAVASPLYLELLDHLEKEEQWKSSTALVPAIVRVLGAYFRKHAVFGTTLESHVQVRKVDSKDYRFHPNHSIIDIGNKKLVNPGFDLINDILHYLPIEAIVPYQQNLVFAMLRRLQKEQTTKLKQQIIITFSIMNCRSQGPPQIPKVLEDIQKGLLNNFVTNIYTPTAKCLISMYDKKVVLLGLAKMCTTLEVQHGDLSTLKSIINACANLMGVMTEQDQPRRRAELDGSEDDLMEVAKMEEFQGTFNVLNAAKIPVTSKELPEVSSSVLLQNIRLCFDNNTVAGKLHNDPAWLQIISFLSRT